MAEVYPVVHVNNPSQALEQSHLAIESGADGLFVIAHNLGETSDNVIAYYEAISSALPDTYIGVNFLQLGSGYEALIKLRGSKQSGAITRFPNALWVDDAMTERDFFMDERDAHPELKTIQYLGGTAFKYTANYTENPSEAAVRANYMVQNRYVDVVTTSGKGTGSPPKPDKIAAMKHQIGEVPLAVASGIDASNFSQFKGIVDKILVASSVETAPYSGVFDEDKLKEFIEIAHAE